MKVAVLFARKDSIYKTMPECDVYDIDRDARNYDGPLPIVGHPPCRAWGVLSHIAKPRFDEKELSPWCVDQIRKWGGVLEHPKASRLWKFRNLPEPGERDSFGGFSLMMPQYWFGHLAEKKTKFYICGIEPNQIPIPPLKLGRAEFVVTTNHSYKRKIKQRPELGPKDREKTPDALAHWLVELASRCKPPLPHPPHAKE